MGVFCVLHLLGLSRGRCKSQIPVRPHFLASCTSLNVSPIRNPGRHFDQLCRLRSRAQSESGQLRRVDARDTGAMPCRSARAKASAGAAAAVIEPHFGQRPRSASGRERLHVARLPRRRATTTQPIAQRHGSASLSSVTAVLPHKAPAWPGVGVGSVTVQ